MSIKNIREFEKLLFKLETNRISTEEQQQLEYLVESNPELAEVYARIKDKTHLREQMTLIRKMDVDQAWKRHTKLVKAKSGVKIRRIVFILGAAATIALLLALGNLMGYFSQSPDTDPVFVEGNLPQIAPKVQITTTAETFEIKDTIELAYFENELKEAMDEVAKEPELIKVEVGTGQIFSFSLPDGSTVFLNAGSSLEYPVEFTAENRQVTLQGEAFFDVVENKQKPFVVTVGDYHVKVLGTRFNMNCYNELAEHKITLISGRVGVETTEEACVLQPDQQASVQVGSQTIEKRDVDAARSVWWMEEKFHFQNTSIQEIAFTLSKWYGLPIETELENTKTFTGVIPKLDNVNDAIEIIRLSTRMKVVIEGNKIVIH
ncbi:MAG: FecR family protein [Draconibacterium sp.]